MTRALSLAAIASASAALLPLVGGVVETCDDTTHQQKIIDWIIESGGAFSDKQEFRRAEDSQIFGIFATEDITEGELLCSVPWKCTISGWDDETDGNGYIYCGGTRALYEEMRKGNSSFYAPYTNYLREQPRGKFPSDFSPAAKRIFAEVIRGNLLPPKYATNMLDLYKKLCEGTDDPLEEKAAMEFWSRSDDSVLIPLYDLYNHVNGHDKINCRIAVNKGESQDVYADRDIKKGEEIRYSYSMSPHITEGGPSIYSSPEFLRDYGFIEPFPQRWIFYDQGFGFDLIEDEEDGLSLRWLSWVNPDPFSPEVLEFLESNLDRLIEDVAPKLKDFEDQVQQGDYPGTQLPAPKEMGVIREYYDALVGALSEAVKNFYTSTYDLCTRKEYEEGLCENDMSWVQYRDLVAEQGIREPEDHENFPTYNYEYHYLDTIDKERSGYQEIEWVRADEMRPDGKTRDVCFKLDGMTQTCSCFSAHYHDIASHFPTRYLDSVRRVAIVGGGDAKMLHEVLKYPTVEKVIHLELDQKILRKSHRYFATQPHFDDDRVEWWFGDAIKSLRMLPSEYFGTFDLVFVDLSESGFLSTDVSSSLTAWEVMAQLVAPEGILIKNELYVESLSHMFDHTIMLYYENVPLILSWALTMGSNRKDLLTPNTTTMKKWNEINTVYEEFHASPADVDDHFKFVHDYQKSDARAQGKCDGKDLPPDTNPLAGILLVIEAEETTNNLEWPKLEGRVLSVLKRVGLTSPSTISHTLKDGKTLCVFFAEEGSVSVRTWPDEKYCAFDVHLWGAFAKMEDLKTRLVEAVGSKAVSSYRVITSGVRGATTYSDDKKIIGPPNVKSRDCTVPDVKKQAIDKKVVIKESLDMIHNKNDVFVVVCGTEGKPCLSRDVISKNENIVTLWTCPNIASINYDNENLMQKQEMFLCEAEMIENLTDAIGESDKGVSAFVVDPSTPINMLKVIDRMWKGKFNQRKFLADQFTFVTIMENKSEIWRRDFLELRRKDLVDMEHLFRAEVAITSSSDSLELGILSGRDPNFFSRLVNVTASIETKTTIAPEITKVEGGIEKLPQDQDRHWYTEDDYDREAGEAQFSSQKPLAEQTIAQLDKKEGEYTAELLKKTMLVAVSDFSTVQTDMAQLGESGLLITCVSVEGTFSLLWDGKSRVSLNAFAYEPNDLRTFFNNFVASEGRDFWNPSSFDEMPRGVGRVVNLFRDLEKFEL